MGWGTHVQLLTIQMVTTSDSPDPETLPILPRLASFYYVYVLCRVMIKHKKYIYKDIKHTPCYLYLSLITKKNHYIFTNISPTIIICTFQKMKMNHHILAMFI